MHADVIAPLLKLDDCVGLRAERVDPDTLCKLADDDQSVAFIAPPRRALKNEDVHVNVRAGACRADGARVS